MNKNLILSAFILGGLGFLVLAQGEQNSQTYPDPKEYAPNFWFDSEENYYPANPLDFYYDEDLNELGGKDARAAYDALSQESKLKSFRVYYNVDGSGNELVYQYWLFYVFNDANNKHYGDWESVFVFIGKHNGEAIKIIGSAHNGNQMKAFLANNELKNPAHKHTQTLIERGSHANWPDGNKNGILDKNYKDISNPINAYGSTPFGWRDWSNDDRDYGLKVEHDSEHYNLRPISEIKDVFGKKYGEERPLISKEKSPTLGMLAIKIGAKKMHALPLGGEPPQNAWLKKEFKNSQEVVPLTPTRLANKASSFFNGVGSAIAGVGKAINLPAANLLTSSVTTRDDGTTDAGDSADEIEEFGETATTVSQETSTIQSRPSPLRPSGFEGQATPNEVPVADNDPRELETELAFVKKVIDGDTIELASGQRVRYIGIDAPEDLLECYAEEAKQRNKSLIEGKQIILLKDAGVDEKDKYDRLLRFVWLDFYQDGTIDSADAFVNLDLLERGYARENDYGQSHQYKHRFETAESEAKRQEIGLWGGACNAKAEIIKETGRDIVQKSENIVEEIKKIALRPFEIAPNVFQFPPPSSGGPAPTPVPTPTPTPTPEPAKRIVINEIQTGDAEFVELYNQFSTSKSLTGYYFSYYSSSKTAWNDPWRNKKFLDSASIPANGYYLIGLKDYPTFGGNPNSDWQPYDSAQLSNTAGTVAIFSFDPSATTSEAAYNSRADAVGWGSGLTLYEQSPAAAPDSGKSISRNSSHADTDNNSSDLSVSASTTPTNSNGKTYDSNFSAAPLWAMYQKDAKHSGLAVLAGPTWTSSAQATSSWTFEMSGGRSQPVIDYAGTVYVTDSVGIVHAINTNGTEKWAFNPDDQTGVGTGYSSASPALSSDSQRIYSVYTDNGERKIWLFSIKASDGTLDWKYATGEDGYNQSVTTPVLDSSGNIYFASQQSIYSVSFSGALNWEKNLSPSRLGLKMPAVDSSGGYIYVSGIVSNTGGDRYIWKLNANDGSEVWKQNPTENNNLSNGISISATGTVYTGGSNDSRLYSVSSSNGSKNWDAILTSGSVKSPIPNFDSSGNIYIGASGAFDSGALNKVSATGTLLWAFTGASLGASSYPAAIDSQGRVYFGAKDKYVYALKGEDGSEIWKYELSGEPVGFAIGKGVVYAVSYDGKVYAFK